MRELFSFIFDQLTDPLTLPVDPLYEWAILGIIGLIARTVSFRRVGDMYRSGFIHGSFLGSLFHWIIRFLIFIPFWFVVYWTIVIGQWIVANWVILLCSLFGMTVLSVVIYRVLFKTNVFPEGSCNSENTDV